MALQTCMAFSYVEHTKKSYFEDVLVAVFHAIAINVDWIFQASKICNKCILKVFFTTHLLCRMIALFEEHEQTEMHFPSSELLID